MTSNMICETVGERIRVARFLRPDVRPALDQVSVGSTALYKEIQAAAIDPLPAGGVLILNMGLIDWFPSIFYGVLLEVNNEVRARGGRLVLCCLQKNPKEGFDLMGGGRTFEVYPTEAKAIAQMQK